MAISKDPKQFTAVVRTPIGKLGIALSDDAGQLVSVDFLGDKYDARSSRIPLAVEIRNQLDAYFRDSAFEFDLPLGPAPTKFQDRLRSQLLAIPAGSVDTYGGLAGKMGSAPRAVGVALRSNPIPVIVPCHRIVAASGIGGFSGKTRGRMINVKQWLLDHERG
ncbi:MAG: methylated-DNA--[protein]-cysteine S-methyltransferase [Gammaproteobacteria bacterium]|nr:methylated-DNA--[protein]-cysteine S-methyltransferase [Gammaproteobacteria bacterium]